MYLVCNRILVYLYLRHKKPVREIDFKKREWPNFKALFLICLVLIWLGLLSRNYWSSLDHDLMASIWEKVISILAGNLNPVRSYIITAVLMRQQETLFSFECGQIAKEHPLQGLILLKKVLIYVEKHSKRFFSRVCTIVPQNKWVYFIVLFITPLCNVKTLITDPITEMGAGPVELRGTVARVPKKIRQLLHMWTSVPPLPFFLHSTVPEEYSRYLWALSIVQDNKWSHFS